MVIYEEYFFSFSVLVVLSRSNRLTLGAVMDIAVIVGKCFSGSASAEAALVIFRRRFP